MESDVFIWLVVLSFITLFVIGIHKALTSDEFEAKEDEEKNKTEQIDAEPTIEEKLKKSQEKTNNFLSQIDSLTIELKSTKQKFEFLKTENQTLLTQIQDLKAEIKKLQKENARKTEELVSKNAAIISSAQLQKEKQEMLEENEELLLTVKNLKEKLKAEKDQNDHLESSISDLQQRLDDFTAHNDYRKRYPANHLCSDGHWVRSKSEQLIDNFFYNNHIRHCYEKRYKKNFGKYPYYPDFYLPDYNLYIEYFGRTNKDYLEKKEEKIHFFEAELGVSFAYLTDEDDWRIEERLAEICAEYNIKI